MTARRITTLTKNDKRKIKKIAKSTRDAFITIVKEAHITHWLKEEEYNTSFHLGGLCQSASTILALRLSRAGYSTYIVEGRGHFFVCLKHKIFGKKKELLIDITATQFGHDEIVIRDWNQLQQQHDDCIRINEYWCENIFLSKPSRAHCLVKKFIEISQLSRKTQVNFLKEIT